jgi:hypothetical protein
MTRLNPLTISVAALVLGLTVAACGGNGKSPSVASANGTTTSSSSTQTPSGGSTANGPSHGSSLMMAGGNTEQMRKLSACMRSHGEPNFPDPDANGAISINGINPDSPAFKHAMEACKKYAPNGGRPPSPAQLAAAQAAALRFSACMRSHGLPNFPDPDFSGGHVSMRINGIDPQSPTFQAAQKACRKDLPGMIKSKAGS